MKMEYEVTIDISTPIHLATNQSYVVCVGTSAALGGSHWRELRDFGATVSVAVEFVSKRLARNAILSRLEMRDSNRERKGEKSKVISSGHTEIEK